MFERKIAPYLFHGQTMSLCNICLAPVPAKIIIEGDDVFYRRHCISLLATTFNTASA